ncbi:prepilin peptidase [Kitasatospora sp. NPDC087861]|uniref:prepilin peptidase n=1 Tax=Kitasatospora sp. NPDC087861 TaxID=3364070 RepID=UPI0037FF6D0E
MPIPLPAATAAGLLTGALLVRPLAFHYTAPTGHPLPRRTCPTCDHPLTATRPHHLYAISLTRRCPHCANRIGPPPLLPEALAGLGVAAVLTTGTEVWVTTAQLWLTVIGAVLVITDASVRRLPDHLTAAAATGVALLLTAATANATTGSLLRAAEAAAVVGAAFFISLIAGGLSMGDLKLAPALAAVLGWHSWTALFWGLTAGFTLGAAHAAVLLATDRSATRGRIAFGPALIVGALAVSTTMS